MVKVEKIMTKEILVYGLAAGDTERYMEDLLASQCQSQSDVDKVIAAASADGWHSFRVAYYDGSPPNFSNTINL
jgi:hypothetical protein